MALTLSQILTSTTEQQALDGILATLREVGFSTGSWQTGSARLSLVRAMARFASGVTTVIPAIVSGGLLGLSRKPWLYLVGDWYALPILPAVSTVGWARWTSSASAPAHVITVGSIIADRTGRRWQVTATFGALAPGDSHVATVTALVPGAAGNAAMTEALVLVTPYSGVTVAFEPAPAPDSPTWITTEGSNEESDARYTRRLQLRWAELTYAVGFRAYELWALTAAPSITRVKVLQNYPDLNLVRVVLANATGAATVPEVAAVQTYVENDGRRAINDLPTAAAADVLEVDITLTPRVRADGATDVQIADALLAFCNALKIGGTRVAGSSAGRLLRDALIEVVMALDGVASVGLSAPAADVVLGGTDIIVPTITVTSERYTGDA